jgi:hypothetical protein
VENVASFPLIHTDLKIEFASETQCIVAINTSSVAYNMASVEINMASVEINIGKLRDGNPREFAP